MLHFVQCTLLKMTKSCTLLAILKLNSSMGSNISDNNSFSYFSRKSAFLINQDLNDFYGHISVPNIFYGIIIGKQGNTLKNIEKNTCTIIKIPRSNNTSEIIVEDHVNYGRQNGRLTHFISIPVKNKKEIQLNFQSFKDHILKNCVGDVGIEEELFQKSHKLHLTLSTLVLGDHKEVGDAIEIINRFKADNPSFFQTPFRVHIKGLGFFGRDISKVKVLFAKIDSALEHERLQNLANQLQLYLYKEHVITKRESESVSLHMTLMNTSFLKSRNRKPFDCSQLVNVGADWDFGVFDIDEMELSVMGSSTDSSYYKNAGSFHFG